MRALAIHQRKANPKRGLPNRDMAIDFAKEFMGKKFSNHEYDEWGFKNGHLQRFDESDMTARELTEARALLGISRRELRKKLNAAGCHPDMEELAFKIVQSVRGHDQWELQKPAKYAQRIQPFEEMAQGSEHLIQSQKLVLEAILWDEVDEVERLRIEMIHRSQLDVHKWHLFFLANMKEKNDEFDEAVAKHPKKRGQSSKLKRIAGTRLLPFLEPDEPGEAG